MDLGLKGKKAILVGASHGIGLATAKILAQEGCDIALCSRSEESVNKAVKAVSAHGTRVIGGAVDVQDLDAHTAWIEKAVETLGGCDIFVPCTSANTGVDDKEGWLTVLNTDILPISNGVQAVVPAMQKAGGGSIVTISSTAAVEEFMGALPYNALKAAVINYSSALSQKLASDGIRVNCVSPGPVFMEGRAWDQVKAGMPEFYDSIFQQIPMGRMGSGEEIAKAIAFIASPACSYMTGANLVIDGGLTKRVDF
jgi:NAD(P)-dependent dehydrogenase (short-subunit alcohol dehydrogenase family)